MVSLEIFIFFEAMVLLNQLIVYFLIIHCFYLFVNGVTPRDFALSIYNYRNSLAKESRIGVGPIRLIMVALGGSAPPRSGLEPDVLLLY